MYNALESNPYYQMINLTYVKFNPSIILQNKSLSVTKRAKFSKLNCKKIKEKLAEEISHWKDAVDRYFRKNQEL